MAEMTPQQQNLLRYLVPLLQAKESAQAVVGPSALGTVLDMILPSSQTVEKMSYGDMPFRMPTQSRIPITTDKQYLADLIGVAGALTPAAKPVQRGVQQLVREIQTTAPKGSINVTGLPNRGRDVIQSFAEDLSSKLKQLGFQADVTHSGSAAGPSSYVKVYDPQTGRFFNQPIRFSGHSKGTFNQAEVRDVNDPSVDLPKIIEDALAMRSQGPSKTFQKQAIVDELIAGGLNPKKAYAQAEQRMAGLLEPQAGKLQSENLEKIYHGTSPKAAKQIESAGFDINKSADGTIWFTSNPQIGEVAATGKGAVVERLIDLNKLKLGGWDETDKFSVDELISQGFDGLRLVDGDEITYQIFNPEKLKKPLK